jgi:hypothetical protein
MRGSLRRNASTRKRLNEGQTENSFNKGLDGLKKYRHDMRLAPTVSGHEEGAEANFEAL